MRTFGKLVRTSGKVVRGLALLTSGPKILITSPSLLTRGLENIFKKTKKLLSIKKAQNPLLAGLWAIFQVCFLTCCKKYRVARSAPAMYVSSGYSRSNHPAIGSKYHYENELHYQANVTINNKWTPPTKVT